MRKLHHKVAAKIESDPNLLRIPLANIDRWLGQGHTAPHRLEHWRTLIKAAQKSDTGLGELLRLLRDESEEAMHLKSFDPFPGVLSRDERREVIRECAFAH